MKILIKLVKKIVKKLVKKIISKYRTIPQKPPFPCSNCKSELAIRIDGKINPDFKINNLISKDLSNKFSKKWNGICMNCGLFQDFLIFNLEENRKFCSELKSKDLATSDENFLKFPLDKEFIKKMENIYWEKRIRNWESFFTKKNIIPKNALFIRPMFGAGPEFISNTYGARVGGLEISEVCNKTTCNRVNNYEPLNGQIHGYFEGDFLNNNNFDSIFVYHTLVHCHNLDEILKKLKNLLTRNGFIIFSDEITRKPSNPFHNLHFSETIFSNILKRHFKFVYRIDDCTNNKDPNVINYTTKKDAPDFLVTNKKYI